MYSARTDAMGLMLEKSPWWTASDRRIPPQRLNWTRPLLARLRMMKPASLSYYSWRRIS